MQYSNWIQNEVDFKCKPVVIVAMMPVKTEMIRRPTYLCSGARRSFFCRMKSGSSMSYLGLKSEKEMDLELCSRKKKSGTEIRDSNQVP